jgi:hypothetical protein
MPNERISGQDTVISILVDGRPLNEITAVKSHEITAGFKVTEEEYCGETSPRFDEFFTGIKGRLEFDVESAEALSIIDLLITRARNRAITTKITIKTVLQFPNGDRAMVNISDDVAFSDVPLSFGGRSEYGKMTLSYSASSGRIVSR